MIQGQIPCFKSDVFAAGCTLIETILGKPIFSDNLSPEELLQEYQELNQTRQTFSSEKVYSPQDKQFSKLHQLFSLICPQLKDLISEMIQFTKQARPFASVLIKKKLFSHYTLDKKHRTPFKKINLCQITEEDVNQITPTARSITVRNKGAHSIHLETIPNIISDQSKTINQVKKSVPFKKRSITLDSQPPSAETMFSNQTTAKNKKEMIETFQKISNSTPVKIQNINQMVDWQTYPTISLETSHINLRNPSLPFSLPRTSEGQKLHQSPNYQSINQSSLDLKTKIDTIRTNYSKYLELQEQQISFLPKIGYQNDHNPIKSMELTYSGNQYVKHLSGIKYRHFSVYKLPEISRQEQNQSQQIRLQNVISLSMDHQKQRKVNDRKEINVSSDLDFALKRQIEQISISKKKQSSQSIEKKGKRMKMKKPNTPNQQIQKNQ